MRQIGRQINVFSEYRLPYLLFEKFYNLHICTNQDSQDLKQSILIKSLCQVYPQIFGKKNGSQSLILVNQILFVIRLIKFQHSQIFSFQ
ncbi:unnamed protein product [Paramecium octaurelia]|uniref:Uncharacterized protein n=1 Tax=Paramecium octaurelia TaxID=43137 RepID=A0A8S1WLG4_PAROT|nr:unnamed protein product [Paramecium octaurelia]